MKVLILKTDKRLGIKKGEIYSAQGYRFDPEKITLLRREPDGYQPYSNQYRDEVGHLIKGVWHRVVDNKYIPITED